MRRTLKLVEPNPSLEFPFLAMAREWQDAGESKFERVLDDFASYLERLESARLAEDLPPDRVPSSTYWLLLDGQRIVGTSRLRHWLLPHLEKEGGHIGYDVRPSERRKGYGTALLALTLSKAKELGLSEVLVTCDSDNIGSVRVIENNGGQLLGFATSDETGRQVNRYRIIVDPHGQRNTGQDVAADTSLLADGVIEIRLVQEVAADPARHWLRALHYDIVQAGTREIAGRVDLRLGYTHDVEQFGGHIGYFVEPAMRGRHYAGRTCQLLRSVAQQHGMDVLWITCNPDNPASRRTCEWIGAEFVEIIDLPPDNDQYQRGERQKCR